jgi:chromosome segregation ATPase
MQKRNQASFRHQEEILSTVPFDTLKLTKALREKAHFTPEQAEGLTEALGDAFEEHVATKEDISDLRHEISDFKHEVAEEFSNVRHEIADVRKDMALLEQRLSNKIDRMSITLGTIVIAAMSAATVIIKFVHT